MSGKKFTRQFDVNTTSDEFSVLLKSLESTGEYALAVNDELRSEPMTIQSLSSSEYVVSKTATAERVFAVLRGDQILVWHRGNSYTFNKVSQTPQRSGASAGGASSGDLKAPMPGTILKVLVNAGDVVTAGQALVIMESMKMEVTIAAPAEGVVESVSSEEGQLVDQGATLVKVALAQSE